MTTDPTRLLLLEDNPTDADLTERILRRADLSFELLRVDDRDAFVEALTRFEPHAVLADFDLPRFDGLSALRLVRQQDAALPFIFVTGSLGEERALDLLRNGASDYITKDRLGRLPDALLRALDMARQRQALHQAEQALKANEERFRTLVETTLDWIWEIDTQCRYTYVSPATRRMLGYEPEELLGKTPFDLMPADESQRVRALFDPIQAERRPFAMLENTCVRKDGERVVLETSGTPIFAPDGAFLGYRGVDRDITERKHNESTLLLMAKRASALLELPQAAERLEETPFMQFGLGVAEKLTASRIAFIHFVSEDQETIELVAWSCRALDGQCQAPSSTHQPVSEAGIWADALRLRRPVVHDQSPEAPGRRSLPTGHAELERFISLPVLEDGRVRMIAAVGDKEIPYTALDVETLQLIANEVWRILRQRRAEQARNASEERLELALGASELGMWDWRVQTGEVQFNERWAEMLGFTLDELAPTGIQTWMDLCHPEDLALAQELLKRHFKRETLYYEAETRLRHKAGHWVWILDRGKVVEWSPDGRAIRMAGIHLDITARKQTEETLRKLSLAVEQSPTSILITDLDARIEYANPAFTRISGYSLEETLGRNPRLLRSGLTPPETYADLWSTLARGETWRGELHNRRKDGVLYVELATISPVRQPDGRITHYLAVKEDISDLKRVEQELERYRLHLEELVEIRTSELRLAEEHSRLLLESSADGLYGVDIEGRATFVNPAACAMLGYAPEEILGRSTHDLFHHTRADGTPYPSDECPLDTTLRHGSVLRGDEEIFWRADGRPFPVTYSSHPILRDGRIVGAVVSFFDISTQKQAEAARQTALVEAERLARLKSEFLANMSHEIRTPLNAVLGFAQVGVRESDDGKPRDLFQRILDSGQLLLGIVDDILDFSKIEAGKLVIVEDEIDLRALIERSVDLLAPRAKDKGLNLRVDEAGDLPATFRGDELRLAQVLANLLSNAIKFTEHGAVVLAIHRDAEHLLLSVTDSGIGMREEQLAHLFQPFEQADGSITRRFGGSGLGLAISKRLVEMMSGEIQVWSRLGRGSRFEVRLPLIEPRGRLGAHRLKQVATQPARGGSRLRGRVILVAEDNPANRLVLEELLSDEGCWLVQVENGQQAVERVREEGPAAFDLVLMDIQMPVLDGLAATRRIRAFAPRLPIIGLTAHALQSERIQCLEAGMDDHLAKPIDLERLVATILCHMPAGDPATPTRPHRPAPNAHRRAENEPPAPDTWIDWPALSARYTHNAAFLSKLLNTILDSCADQAQLLREAAARDDKAQLAFIAHRLKGTAANILATRLREMSADTERQARAQEGDPALQAYRLADALDELLDEIEHSPWRHSHPTTPAARTPPHGHDAPTLSAVLAQLQSRLADDDTAANQLYERHQGLIEQAFGEGAKRLGTQIECFDYQAARDTLNALIASGVSTDKTIPE